MAGSRSVRKYSWREGSFGVNKAKAVAFGETLEKIKRAGGWTAGSIVAAATDPQSPIHDMFEWDDSVAGRKYREGQARTYVRSLVVEIIGPEGPKAIPVAVSFGAGEDYIDTTRVMSNSDMRERLVGQAMHEATRWQARYQYLHELSEVFEAIEKVQYVKAG